MGDKASVAGAAGMAIPAAGLSDSAESDVWTVHSVAHVSDSAESDIQTGMGASHVSDSLESDIQGAGEQRAGERPLTRAQIHVGEPAGEPLLDAVDLVAGYIPGVNILNGASLTLHEGEIVGIIGPNGAGKSTLLKSLFGLVRIHSGKLLLKGEDITNLRADKLVSRGVGFVPQTENVFPSLTIAENMHMGAFQAPKLFDERFDYVCSIFPKLGQRKNQLAGQLSGGERQMVAMARALMMKPSVLLLDEPSAGLSPMLQDETFIRVRQVNKAGVSVVIVEQNARRCLQICDRGYVLDQGRNAYSGKGRDLMNDPKVVSLYLGNLEEEVQEEGR